MKISILRSQLNEALQDLSKVISRTTTLPVLGCLRIDAKDDKIVAQGTDLDQVVEYRFSNAQAEIPGTVIVPFLALKPLTKGAGFDRIEIIADSPAGVTVVNHVGSHAVRQTVQGMERDEWPAMLVDVATEPAEGFLETYRRLAPFASTV